MNGRQAGRRHTRARIRAIGRKMEEEKCILFEQMCESNLMSIYKDINEGKGYLYGKLKTVYTCIAICADRRTKSKND